VEQNACLPALFEIDVLSVDTAERPQSFPGRGEINSHNGKFFLRIPYQELLPPVKLKQIRWKEDKPILNRARRFDSLGNLLPKQLT
jgi:hypothetical protein